MTPSPVFTQLWANEKRLTAEFYGSFLKITRLHICGISDGSAETTKSYTNFNDELRWLWNLVYIVLDISFKHAPWSCALDLHSQFELVILLDTGLYTRIIYGN